MRSDGAYLILFGDTVIGLVFSRDTAGDVCAALGQYYSRGIHVDTPTWPAVTWCETEMIQATYRKDTLRVEDRE